MITEANQAFAEVSAYTVEQLMGKPHNIVRHPDMPKEAFADMWRSLQAGRPWQGVVKNRRSDGGFYWVVANVSPVREGDRIVGYQSVRLRPSRETIRAAEDAYRRIKAGDRSIRIEAGRVVPVQSALKKRISFPSMQIALFCYAVFLLGMAGAASLLALGGTLSAVGSVMCAALAVVALIVRFGPLAHLRRELLRIESYLDCLLETGDLTMSFKDSQYGTAGRVGQKMTLFTGWVQATLFGISDALQAVRQTSAQLVEGIEAIHMASKSQNGATTSVASAATELSLTIQEMSANLRATEQQVTISGKEALSGEKLSLSASQEIEKLSKVIAEASGEVSGLADTSEHVGRIAQTIREIASQTNLLSLNASIEAQRAGDAGRGFAVVANEVRRLADRTSQATTEIESLLEKISEVSGRAITAMQNGEQQAETGVTLVKDSQETLKGINERMVEAVHKVSGIAAAATQQTSAMADIDRNISHVAAMTEQSVGVVERAHAQMEGLKPLLERVHKAVHQYRI